MNMQMTEHEREAERLLDEALAQRGNVEPRSGLETRILARLAAEPQRSVRSLWWWGALAAGTAAALAALFWLGGLALMQAPPAPVVRVVPPPDGVIAPRNAAPPTEQAQRRRAGRGQSKVPEAASRRLPPKLEQFPSPAPLSEQERLLARYAREFPEKAALAARIQAGLRKEAELEMTGPGPNDRDSTGSEQ